jgi:hypothetical protein
MSVLSIPRVTDRAVLNFFRDAAKLYNDAQLSASTIDGKTLDAKNIESYLERNPDNFYIITVNLYWIFDGTQRYSLSFSRASVIGSNQDPFIDQLNITDNGATNLLPENIGENILKIATERFNPGFFGIAADRSSAKQANRLFSAYMSSAENTRTSLEDFVNQLKGVISIADERIAKQKKADLESTEKIRKNLQSEFEEKKVKLDTQHAELDELAKKLDDRNNTHARRQIRQELINIVDIRNKEFSLSKNTNSKRWPIHAIFVTIIIIFAVLYFINVYYGNSFTISDSDSVYILIIKLLRNAFPLAGLFATAAVYTRWMTSWAQRHAEFEFAQRQFELDINRASWAVESSLEWRQSQGSSIPEPLLVGMTRSLFESQNTKFDDTSALDALASALIGSSNLKLKIGDHEAEISQKAMKKLDKTPD